MEQREYLIDSNVVVDYLNKKFDAIQMVFMNEIIDKIPNLSVISKIEVLSFNANEEYTNLLADFINDAIIIDLTTDIVNRTILLRKKYKIKVPDAIIAATALVFDYTIITNNEKDFANIKSLKVLNPYKVLN